MLASVALASLLGPQAAALPKASEIQAALVADFPAAFVPSRPEDLRSGPLKAQLEAFLASQTKDRPFREGLSTNRILVLLYPSTATEYKDTAGNLRQFQGRMSSTDLAIVQSAISRWPLLYQWLTDGMTRLEVNLRTIDRPLTYSTHKMPGTRLTHQVPQVVDTKPEATAFGRESYDGFVVLHYPGPIPQDLGGSGGGGQAEINLGNIAGYRSNDLLSALATEVHEWTHSTDWFYGDRSYAISPLHHLYAASYEHRWFRPLLTGTVVRSHEGFWDERENNEAIELRDAGEARYGYSRAVWGSGSRKLPVAQPPLQLLAPLPGSAFPADAPIRLRVAGPVVGPVRVLVYKDEELEKPVYELVATADRLVIPASTLPIGSYVWTAQTQFGSSVSRVGDAHRLRVVDGETMPGISMMFAPLPARVASGSVLPILVSIASPAGIAWAQAEVKMPDGSTQRAVLRRRYPHPNSSLWAGAIVIPGHAEDKPKTMNFLVRVADQAGRTSFVGSPPIATTAEVISPVDSPVATTRVHASTRLIASESVARFLVDVRGTDANDAWLEITGPDGKSEVVSVTKRGWDDGDWRTGATAARQALVRIPENPTPAARSWQVVSVVKDELGRVSRAKPVRFEQPPAIDIPDLSGQTFSGSSWSVDSGKKHPFGVLKGWQSTRVGLECLTHGSELILNVPPSRDFDFWVTIRAIRDAVIEARSKPVALRPEWNALTFSVGVNYNTMSVLAAPKVSSTSGDRLPAGGWVTMQISRRGNTVVGRLGGKVILRVRDARRTPIDQLAIRGGYQGRQAVREVRWWVDRKPK